MAIEIVDLPIENGGSFHSYVNVYQRVTFVITIINQIGLPWSVHSTGGVIHHLNNIKQWWVIALHPADDYHSGQF